jgi:lysozyme
MGKMLPASRPQWSRERVMVELARLGVTAPVALFAGRGYYRDSMGVVGRNDRGIYDDAIFLIGPNVFASYNANTDPGRTGINPKVGKPYAVLAPGVWSYMVGKHKGEYTALVQADPVLVVRDTYEETGWFGINIHRGSVNSTSSEGCQTIHPTQWAGFIAAVQLEMMRCKVKRIPYALAEVQG